MESKKWLLDKLNENKDYEVNSLEGISLDANFVAKLLKEYKMAVLSQAYVSSSEAEICGKPCDELRTACKECKDKFYEWNAKQSQTYH